MLPYNLLAEKSILNILINNPQIIYQVESYLSEDSFYVSSHKILYKSLLELEKNSEKINSTTLITYLQDKNLLQEIGGLSSLISIIQQRESLFYLKSYISLLNDKALRRNLILLGEQLIEWGYLTEQPLDVILDEVELKVSSLSQRKVTEKMATSAEILVEALEDLQSSKKDRFGKGYFSQYEDLDTILQGFQNTDMIILAGRPSMGKTALALNFLRNIANAYNIPVIFFSLEMSRKQIIYRLLSIESYVESTRLKLGKLTNEEWLRILEAAEKLASLSVFIEDNALITLMEIKSKIKKIYFEYKKIALVVIDYLQLIKVTNKFNNRVQEITYITKTLKAFAKEFDTPFLVLSQLSRNVESRVNKRPILSDLRESGCFNLVNFEKTPYSFTGNSIQQTLFSFDFFCIGHKLGYSIFQKHKLIGIFSMNHKFSGNLGWIKFQEIAPESCLFYNNLSSITNFDFGLNITFDGLPYWLYDLTILDHHNFFYRGVLIHNSIEQDADIVLMIYRDDYYKTFTRSSLELNNLVELIIAKHRNGPVGFVDIVFDSNIYKF